MDAVTLAARSRSELGKNQIKKIRNEGWIPAIIYGSKTEPTPISIDPRALLKLYNRSDLGRNTIIELDVEGGKKETVISYQFSRNAITQEFTHVDFKRVDDKTKVKIDVRLRLEGVAPGTKMGGLLIKKMDRITMECLPKDIPGEVVVDISAMTLNTQICVGDLNLGSDITILSRDGDLIVRVAAPKGKSVDEEDEGTDADGGEDGAEGGDAGESGDAAAADAPAEASADADGGDS